MNGMSNSRPHRGYFHCCISWGENDSSGMGSGMKSDIRRVSGVCEEGTTDICESPNGGGVLGVVGRDLSVVSSESAIP